MNETKSLSKMLFTLIFHFMQSGNKAWQTLMEALLMIETVFLLQMGIHNGKRYR